MTLEYSLTSLLWGLPKWKFSRTTGINFVWPCFISMTSGMQSLWRERKQLSTCQLSRSIWSLPFFFFFFSYIFRSRKLSSVELLISYTILFFATSFSSGACEYNHATRTSFTTLGHISDIPLLHTNSSKSKLTYSRLELFEAYHLFPVTFITICYVEYTSQ
jgi:hypothetical protein